MKTLKQEEFDEFIERHGFPCCVQGDDLRRGLEFVAWTPEDIEGYGASDFFYISEFPESLVDYLIHYADDYHYTKVEINDVVYELKDLWDLDWTEIYDGYVIADYADDLHWIR